MISRRTFIRLKMKEGRGCPLSLTEELAVDEKQRRWYGLEGVDGR